MRRPPAPAHALLAENAIGDEGFSLICREILTPPQEEEGAWRAQAQPTPLLDADDEPPEDCPGLVGHLLDLSFFRNPIGDKGLAALAEALRLGALPKLECLNISGTASTTATSRPGSAHASNG